MRSARRGDAKEGEHVVRECEALAEKEPWVQRRKIKKEHERSKKNSSE